VFALFLAAFAVGTTEVIIAGLLPSLAADLAVDIPTAGLLISFYAAGVAPAYLLTGAGLQKLP
jgi:DHA1 family inner membrane transport protein